MRHEILHRPTASLVRLVLEPGESVRAESGAMVAMSPTIELESGLVGGITRAFGRLLTGESVRQTTFVAATGGGELLLAPGAYGDVTAIELRGDAYMVNSGAFLACASGLTVHTRTTVKGFLLGEGLFVMRVSGAGTLFINALGALHPVELQPGERYVVDSGHVAAFSDTMEFRVRKAAKSFVGSALSGEGVVAEFTGPGLIFLQTRSPDSLAAYLASFLPKKR